MSHLSVRGEQSTNTEIEALTNLTELDISGSGQFIYKTGTNTFANGTPSGGGGGGTVTSISSANGALTITTPTTTPVLTIVSAPILTTARTIGGVSFDGSANITVATATGGFTVSGGDLALGTNSITMTGSLGATGARLTKGWFTDLESTNAIVGSITGNAATATAVAVGGITGLGTGVATALAINVGSAGAVVVLNGALGTPSSGTVTNLTGTASININGTVGATTPSTAVVTTLTVNTNANPDADDGAGLGTTTLGWSDIFLASGGTVHFANTDWVATHTAGILTVGTGDLRVTTAGTNTASVVTVGGTQTLTSKTLTSPAIGTSITTSDVSFTAFAGATTLLTIGGTGASASLFAPSTLDTSSSVTGAIRTSGGISAAKAGWIGTNLNVGVAGTATGELRLSGATSGTVTIKTNATAGTWTLELPANDGDSGQFLQTNGSGVAIWAAATVATSPNVKFATMFDSSTRWSTNHSSGTATFGASGVSLDTTATGSRQAHIYASSTISGAKNEAYLGSPSFSCSFACMTIGTTGNSFCGIGDPSTAGVGSTVNHAGFFAQTVAGVCSLYASNSAGSANTKSSALTTIAAGDVVDCYLKFNASTSIDYYWRINGGAWSSATNQSTNIPIGDEATYMSFFAKNTTGQFVVIYQAATLER